MQAEAARRSLAAGERRRAFTPANEAPAGKPADLISAAGVRFRNQRAHLPEAEAARRSLAVGGPITAANETAEPAQVLRIRGPAKAADSAYQGCGSEPPGRVAATINARSVGTCSVPLMATERGFGPAKRRKPPQSTEKLLRDLYPQFSGGASTDHDLAA